MRIIISLIIPLVLSACSELAPDSVVMADDMFAYMDFKTETLNAGASSDTVTIRLESSDNLIEVSTVKLNGTTMTFGSNGYQSTTTTINEGDTFDVDCYLNQSNVIYNESVEDSKITIQSLPEFKIKVADQLSDLASLKTEVNNQIEVFVGMEFSSGSNFFWNIEFGLVSSSIEKESYGGVKTTTDGLETLISAGGHFFFN